MRKLSLYLGRPEEERRLFIAVFTVNALLVRIGRLRRVKRHGRQDWSLDSFEEAKDLKVINSYSFFRSYFAHNLESRLRGP